jgi:hypothetical protein
MPIIRLDRSNSREAICLVVEKVNVGGKKLDAFELVTAIYASDNYDLREDWNGPIGKPMAGRRARALGSPNPRVSRRARVSVRGVSALATPAWPKSC